MNTSSHTANRPTCLILMCLMRLRKGEQIRQSWRCQLSQSLSCQCSLSPVGPSSSLILIPCPHFYHCFTIFCLFVLSSIFPSLFLSFLWLTNSCFPSTGLFSINVHVPHNGWIDCPTDTLCEPDGSMSPFNYFAAIVIGIALVACCMVSVIRWWRWDARKKFGRLRGIELPNAWDGFWGWE